VTSAGLSVPAPLRLQHLPTTDSTNRVAMDAARAGAPGGLVVVADTQTAGRGRQGRSWLDSEGSLLASFLLRTSVPARDAWAFSFVAGLAALHVARTEDVASAWLKWPNDLWVGDRKAGGVLCELAGADGGGATVVLGVGLNLVAPSQGWDPALQDRATALSAGRAPVPRSRALQSLCEGVLQGLDLVERVGIPALVLAVGEAMAPMVGRAVQVEHRGALVAATVAGIGQNGALRLTRGDGGEIELLAGDVHLGTATPSPEEA
jgi:BirA family biotin operon repressor/biotin-[acetyl-CoA-carboxylase] ligase